MNWCEWSTSTLTCPTGQYLKFWSAVYGRQSKDICQSTAMSSTSCTMDVSKYVRNLCGDRNSCSLSVSNGNFGGDPCVGTSKYLAMGYTCETPVRYMIYAANKANLCLDINVGSTSHLWDCSQGNTNQVFVYAGTFNNQIKLASLVTAATQKCLDDGGSKNFKAYDCDVANNNQLFIYDPATRLLKALGKPGKCLDDGGSTRAGDGKYAKLYNCDSANTNQLFNIVVLDNPITCYNGGRVTLPNSCWCPSGYAGNNCELGDCSSSPCQNGGTCTGPNTCSCLAGWTGTNCTTPVCSQPCQNSGTCVAPNMCSCTAGWTGNTCSLSGYNDLGCYKATQSGQILLASGVRSASRCYSLASAGIYKYFIWTPTYFSMGCSGLLCGGKCRGTNNYTAAVNQGTSSSCGSSESVYKLYNLGNSGLVAPQSPPAGTCDTSTNVCSTGICGITCSNMGVQGLLSWLGSMVPLPTSGSSASTDFLKSGPFNVADMVYGTLSAVFPATCGVVPVYTPKAISSVLGGTGWTAIVNSLQRAVESMPLDFSDDTNKWIVLGKTTGLMSASLAFRPCTSSPTGMQFVAGFDGFGEIFQITIEIVTISFSPSYLGWYENGNGKASTGDFNVWLGKAEHTPSLRPVNMDAHLMMGAALNFDVGLNDLVDIGIESDATIAINYDPNKDGKGNGDFGLLLTLTSYPTISLFGGYVGLALESTSSSSALYIMNQGRNDFTVASTSTTSLGGPVSTSINGVDISSYVTGLLPGLGLTFQMTTAFYATQTPGSDVYWGVMLRGSMGAITISLPREVKDVINQINQVIRIDILSQIPHGKDLFNGYSIAAGSAGVGLLGTGSNLPQLFVVLNDGKYLFSPVCSRDSQCADGSVCWYNAICVPLMPNGGPCTDNSQCQTGTCLQPVCAPFGWNDVGNAIVSYGKQFESTVASGVTNAALGVSKDVQGAFKQAGGSLTSASNTVASFSTSLGTNAANTLERQGADLGNQMVNGAATAYNTVANAVTGTVRSVGRKFRKFFG